MVKPCPGGAWWGGNYRVLTSLLLAALVLCAIWLPELSHWYVRPVTLTNTALAELRRLPERTKLDEVAAMQLRGVVVAPDLVLASAAQVLRGTLQLPGMAAAPVTLPFAVEDLDRGPPAWALMVATLAAADVLLDAYAISLQEALFLQARDSIVAFAHIESARWLDRGALWNDHAISARVPVLVKFWLVYRQRDDFDPVVAQAVLGLVARSAQLLAKPSFYTWRTSHGILADLALLQIATAFPALPESAMARRIAVERFSQHLPYFINAEGVTLLHSAGYHAGSLYHFGLALRLFSLNGVPIPEAWWERYAGAVAFYALLRRPDGTLPMFGDTNDQSQQDGPPLTARQPQDGAAARLAVRPDWPGADAGSLYPAAGHALWWDGTQRHAPATGSQTAITWSYYPGLGHKLADELSVLFWSVGRTWVSNTGYWPYGLPGREQAESWSASNAPHLQGESPRSARTSRVRAQGQGVGLAFIDLERSGPPGYAVRRQIIRLAADDAWLVLDDSRDAMARTSSTHWTFFPDLTVTPLPAAGVYQVVGAGAAKTMVASFSGSTGISLAQLVGSETPFAGWVVRGRSPRPASTIVVRQPSQRSWQLATFVLADAGQASRVAPGARMLEWRDDTHWRILLATASGPLTLSRDGSDLRVEREGSQEALGLRLTVTDVASAALVGVQAAEVQSALRAAAEKYPQFSELITYRVKVSALLLALLAGQELFFFWLGRVRARLTPRLRVLSWLAWSTGGLWLSQIYLQ